jgi:RimJ/RimL family protein N-acetyltransferase
MIDVLRPDDAIALFQHVRRHMRENGSNGLVFAPHEAGVFEKPQVLQERVRQWQAGLQRNLNQPEWLRVWVAYDPDLPEAQRTGQPDGGIIGHVELAGGRMGTELHRCRLSMGVYGAHRGRGLGRVLLGAAVLWAQRQPELVWMDLSVFSHNSAALHLYEQAGFQEVGRTIDAFRVQGGSLDDVHMALRLK